MWISWSITSLLLQDSIFLPTAGWKSPELKCIEQKKNALSPYHGSETILRTIGGLIFETVLGVGIISRSIWQIKEIRPAVARLASGRAGIQTCIRWSPDPSCRSMALGVQTVGKSTGCVPSTAKHHKGSVRYSPRPWENVYLGRLYFPTWDDWRTRADNVVNAKAIK